MPRRSPADGGFVTPAFLGAVGLTMVLLVIAANALAVHYAGGVMQAAVEEGARQGVAAGTAACAARAQAIVDNGLGAMADQVGSVDCVVAAEGTAVSLSAVFQPWVPGLPAQEVAVRARAASRPASVP